MANIEEFFSAKWIKPLFERLIQIRESREREIRHIGDVFGDPEELAKYYIEPYCQHINPANEDEDEPSSVVVSPVFKTINKFLGGDFSVRGDGRSQLFVLSDAGMGKTSLLVMLQLAELTSFWPKKYSCRLFKLNAKSIDEIRNIQDKSTTVLLLDALDEDHGAWGRVKERLIDILDETVNFRRVIITCRTQFFPNDEVDPFKRVGKIKVGDYVCPMFFMSLFDEEQVELYLEKRFRGSGRVEHIERAKKIILDMGSLRFRPLLLAHIDGFLEAGHLEWNEYLVYETLINTWLMREQRKLRQQNRSIAHEELLKACLIVAHEMHKESGREMPQSKLNEMVATFPELSNLQLIDVGGRSLMNKNSDDEYRFSHYSIQEFLMAFGIVENVFIQRSSIRCTDKILAFLDASRSLEESLPILNFENVNLSGMSFENIRMPGIFMKNANLSRANFRGAFLRESVMSNADLRGADFSSANLTNANLEGTNSEGALFKNCVMVGSNMSNSNFDRCDFTGATLSGSKREESSFEQAIFRNAWIR
jgi:uncharacterized protein YjbI with pentapeptide repeats